MMEAALLNYKKNLKYYFKNTKTSNNDLLNNFLKR